MSLKQFYKSRSEMGKNLLLLGGIALLGFLATICFFFLNNPGIPLGWLLGSVTSMLAYITIVKGSSLILGVAKGSRKGALLAPLFMLGRFLMYGGVLLLSAFCSFRWGTIESSWLNFWATFAGLMPLYGVLIVATLMRLAAEAKEAKTPTPVTKKEEEKHE